MLKLCLVLLAVLGLSTGEAASEASNDPGKLDAVLDEFTALVDTEQIKLIMLAYLFDHEFQSVMQFTISREFRALYREVINLPESKEFSLFLEESGLHIQKFTSPMKKFMLPQPGQRDRRKIRGGIVGLIEELLELIPSKKLKALADYHVENTPEFAALYNRMRSPELTSMMLKLQQHPTVVKMGDELMAKGVDVNLIIVLINDNLGWGLAQHKSVAY